MSESNNMQPRVSVEINNSSNKKKLLIIVFVILAIIAVSVIGILIYKESNKYPVMGMSSEQIRTLLDESIVKETQDFTNKANAINTLDELKKLSESEQSSTGEVVMQRLYANKEYVKLLEFADYLADFDGTVALTSLKYCYILETNVDKKSDCLDRINQEARSQGIIKNNETLPESYFEISEGEK